jgi:hypothetical protein
VVGQVLSYYRILEEISRGDMDSERVEEAGRKLQ